jgi:hypothetical protein
VPGVEVCPRHKVFLENSSVRARNRVNSALYVSAEQAIRPTNARSLDLHDEVHEGLLGVARDAAWLLNQPGLNPGYDLLYAHYQELLSGKNLANRGYVYTRELLNAMTASVPRLLLLPCSVSLTPRRHTRGPPFYSKTSGRVRHIIRCATSF